MMRFSLPKLQLLSCLAVSIYLVAAMPGSAQETRSMIFGRVLDPQFAAVSGAAVTVTNVDTNTSTTLNTNQTGYYEALLLLPGSYRVSAELSGFKTTIRTGLTLPVSTRLEVGLQLELGTVAESVSVTAEAPLLDTSSVSSGRVMDNRDVMSLPVFNNSPGLLVKMAPGVQSGNERRYNGVNGLGGASEHNAFGGVGGSDWSLDGAPNAGSGYQPSYLPYSDTVQEFKIETSNFDASVGKSSGASIAIMTKSGTNAVHGSLTEQHWQQRWNGAKFFVKQLYYRKIAEAEAAGNNALADRLRSEPMQPSGHSNNYAASLGGPVVIPKVFNGKDKLFFFFSFDGFTDRKPEESSINRTVPTLANLQGDFSKLLNVNASRYQIYDPLSVRPDPNRPTHYIRNPMPGNIIPKDRIINPAYNAYAAFYPRPNNDPTSSSLEPSNNYLAVAMPFNWNYKSLANRFDYLHSDKHRFFGRWSWLQYREDRQDWTYETARGLHTWGLNRNNANATVDWVYTMNSSTVFNVVLAASDFEQGSAFVTPFQYKPSDVGLPAYLDQKAGDLALLPTMTLAGYTTIGQDVPTLTHHQVFTSRVHATHIRGTHSLRAGFEQRQQYKNGGGGGNTSGRFGFSNAYTRRYDDTFAPAGNLGHSFASFMMGLPDSVAIATTDSYALHNPYYAGYVQDSWRALPGLTLTLGLRLEYEQGITERYNRFISGLDPTAKLLISDAAMAAYAQKPIPELQASQFEVAGGPMYPGVNGRSRQWNRNELMWLPRLGVAYQLTPKTVLRGGYGLYFDTMNALNMTPDQSGYSLTTSSITTTDYGMNWLLGDPASGISPLADPFPVRSDGTRFDAPNGNSLGLMAEPGSGWNFLDYDVKRARQQRWRAGIQRQLGGNSMIEVAYVGSYTDRAPVDRKLDYLSEQFWADGTVRNNAIATDMNSNVPNPFYIDNFASLQTSHPAVYQRMSTLSFFKSPTVRKNQLLRDFPHMNGLTENRTPLRLVRTDSLEVVYHKRFSKGFQMNLSYVRLRDRERDYWFNEFDQLPSWVTSGDGRPHRIAATGVWELPFGRGKALANRGIWSALFGGFQIAATYEWQPGPLIGFGNLFYYGDINDIPSDDRRLDQWFNMDNFERTASKGPAAYHRRVFPYRIEGLRSDSLNRWDTNIQRQFKIKEKLTLDLRLDVLNLTNRSHFSDPVTDPYSTNFGRVVSHTGSTNRFLQIQGRVRF